MNGTTLDEGLNQYSWNNQTGILSIGSVTGDISITASGVPLPAPATYASAQDLTLGSGVSLIPYHEIENLNDSTSSNTYLQNSGTNLVNAVDNGKVSAVLTENINNKDTIAVVPVGFTISSTTGENTISGGLVLREGLNEFVFTPYTDSSVYTESSLGPLDNRIDSTSGAALDSQEQLDYYYGKNYYNYARDFDYVQDKANIEESINKYRGFIVGRYETTITSNGTIGSMPNETVITASSKIPQTNYKYVRWYGLYKVQKDVYARNNIVFSTMITDREWTRIMSFTGYGSATRDTDTTYTTKPDKSGSSYANDSTVYDVTHNIYDLAGNVSEWNLGHFIYYRYRRRRRLLHSKGS